MTGAQWRKRRKNYPGSDEKFVLVMVMDPNWLSWQAALYSAPCELHQWHTLTDDAARKTDINIFEEYMRGANGDTTVILV